MRGLIAGLCLSIISLLSGMVAFGAEATRARAQVTFNKDVLPILQKNCQTCHRPGEIGPMSLLTYEDARPWAKSIRADVLLRKMPPWFADPHYGHFSNDRRLSDEDIHKLAEWADEGAPEGDPQDRPAPVAWTAGWNIHPDVVFEMPKPYTIPKDGELEYTYFLIHPGFTEDTFIEDAEVRPSNRAVVHHVSVWVRPPGSTWLKDAKEGEPYTPPQRAPGTPVPAEEKGANEWLTGYLPGVANERYFAPDMRAAKMIPAGSDILLEMHYTPNGKEPVQDQTRLGLVFSKQVPKYRLLTVVLDNQDFVIPPGDANYEGHETVTFNSDVTLVYLEPHMHMRGKDMQIDFTYPSGERETMLKVDHYSYLWQTIYREEKPLLVPKGTRVDVTAHWDNSANNPLNPDPTATVGFGIQSWNEMLEPFIGILVEIQGINPEE